MTGIIMILGLGLIIGIMTSTRADRARARERLSRLNWPLGIATAAIWAALIFL